MSTRNAMYVLGLPSQRGIVSKGQDHILSSGLEGHWERKTGGIPWTSILKRALWAWALSLPYHVASFAVLLWCFVPEGSQLSWIVSGNLLKFLQGNLKTTYLLNSIFHHKLGGSCLELWWCKVLGKSMQVVKQSRWWERAFFFMMLLSPGFVYVIRAIKEQNHDCNATIPNRFLGSLCSL